MNVAFLDIFWMKTEKNFYLTDNFLKQGYKILFLPQPRCNYGFALCSKMILFSDIDEWH